MCAKPALATLELIDTSDQAVRTHAVDVVSRYQTFTFHSVDELIQAASKVAGYIRFGLQQPPTNAEN